MIKNIEKLHSEFFLKNLPVVSVHIDGSVEFFRELSETEQLLANSIISNFLDSKYTWDEIRDKRDKLLSVTDFIVGILDGTVPENTNYQDWVVWRQSLRDLPNNYSNPDMVIFPNPPLLIDSIKRLKIPFGIAVGEI